VNPKRTEPASLSEAPDDKSYGAVSIELARLIHALDEVDPLAARIARWRYLNRRFSDQQIAERLGWHVGRVIDRCDRALAALSAHHEQQDAA
jgi:DNA-directed RNA polymerase specialized sigma24 family protein